MRTTGVVGVLGAVGLRSAYVRVSRLYVLKPLREPVAASWTAMIHSTLAFLVSASEAGSMGVMNLAQMSTVRKSALSWLRRIHSIILKQRVILKFHKSQCQKIWISYWSILIFICQIHKSKSGRLLVLPSCTLTAICARGSGMSKHTSKQFLI